MKTRIIANISPAAIAIALFCAVAVLAPTPTSPNTKKGDSAADSLRQAPLPRIPGDPSNTAATNTLVSGSGRLIGNSLTKLP